MNGLGLRGRIPVHLGDVALQYRLVVFDGQHILGQRRLRMHRIRRYHPSDQIQGFEQGTRGGDFIGFGVYRLLAHGAGEKPTTPDRAPRHRLLQGCDGSWVRWVEMRLIDASLRRRRPKRRSHRILVDYDAVLHRVFDSVKR